MTQEPSVAKLWVSPIADNLFRIVDFSWNCRRSARMVYRKKRAITAQKEASCYAVAIPVRPDDLSFVINSVCKCI